MSSSIRKLAFPGVSRSEHILSAKQLARRIVGPYRRQERFYQISNWLQTRIAEDFSQFIVVE
jgi:hypothetical protein